jgi:LAGLIDADG-like domain/Homeodomain-like domain
VHRSSIGAPGQIKQQALELIAAGHNDCEVSRRLGIPRGTIRDWRRPGNQRRVEIETCPRCWRAAKPIRFTPGDYCELLGLYLGDGCISTHARTCRLRIALDAKYPGIIGDAVKLLERSLPENPVGLVEAHGGTMYFVSVYSSHLPCLFPQHGAGPKHERSIRLEDWQGTLIGEAPWAFLRGCIRSDGCCFVNRTGRYEYLSYDFSSMSRDIAQIFAAACDEVGVEYRVAHGNKRGLWDVRINRRDSVAAMLAHVGRKR